MITITYELYGNDFTRKENLKRNFNNLEEMRQWINENAYTGFDKVFYPSKQGCGRVSFDTKTMNTFYGFKWCDCWIHMIESEKGIEFTDGTYTSGQKHMSEEIDALFRKWTREDKEPKTYNFVK